MSCPICRSNKMSTLLELPKSPIYQHPVTFAANIPTPHSMDLTYLYCGSCGHSHQKNFNAQLMDVIYQSHYYTPAPSGIGATFRNEFIDFIQAKIQALPPQAGILEIGSSSGELLLQIRELRPDCGFLGFEPSSVSAQTAGKHGVPTRQAFFNCAGVDGLTQRFELIMARHVIEHLTDFKDFFNAVEQVCASKATRLVLETPALEAHWASTSIAPFHVEHAHVFSAHSLTFLADQHGWYPEAVLITESQNLILCFIRDPALAIEVELLQQPNRYPDYFRLFRTRLAQEVGNRKIILWGAGSGGLKLVAYHDLSIAHLVDGNPEKKGMRFIGLSYTIETAAECLIAVQQSGCEQDYCVVIGSGFYREIARYLHQLHWRGGVVAPYSPEFLTVPH